MFISGGVKPALWHQQTRCLVRTCFPGCAPMAGGLRGSHHGGYTLMTSSPPKGLTS